eukprot:gene5861-8974_t
MELLLDRCRGTDELLGRIEALNVKGQHQHIGNYRVIRTLGKGCFGVVKLCKAPTGEEVAVKVVTKGELDTNPGQRHRVEAEMKALRSFNHPYICRLIETQELERGAMKLIAMEYLPGGELYDVLLKQDSLSAEQVYIYFAQAHCAVVHLHHHQWYHRDLKLENLLLDAEGNVKLCDFGFCCKVSMPGERIATQCGSPHYAAPEVIRKITHVPAAAEVWSLGVILFTLATSTLPFDGPTQEVAQNLALAGKFNVPDDVPSTLADLLSKMLVVDPKARIGLTDVFSHPWYSQRFIRLPIHKKQVIEAEIS